jgi:hypothetical protein
LSRRYRCIAAAAVAALLAVPAARASAAPLPSRPRPFLVGFEDEASFLWGPNRFAMLRRAAAAHASIVRVVAEWRQIAPRRPRAPRSPADPAYHFEGLDDLVWHAQLQGMRVLLTIWGTPRWATRSGKPNAAPPPSRLGDFCFAVARRYSGRFRGQPFVPYLSVWNEPNLNQYLAPQFDAKGRDRAPQLYAGMFRACRNAIKKASPYAHVAIGETSPRGHDAPRGLVQASHSPGRFAELLAKVRPRLQFDAWAHHPYPQGYRGPPTASFRWPNVGVGNLARFELRLRRMFARPSVPLWLTEFAYQTTPERPGGVTYAQQAAYLARALRASAAVPQVQMFVWYVFRDRLGQRWQSGVLRRTGAAKPAYAAFARVAAAYDVANPTLVIPPQENPVVRLSVVDFKSDKLPGDPPIGMTYRVYDSTGTVIASAQPRAALDVYGNIKVTLRFKPRRKSTYTATFDLNDIHGHTADRRARLIVSG